MRITRDTSVIYLLILELIELTKKNAVLIIKQIAGSYHLHPKQYK